MAERGPIKITVPDLARVTGVPRPFLRKIFQTLSKEGILESSKGKQGGFRLAIPPDQIVLARIFRIFQGSLPAHDCLLREPFCVDLKDCPLKRRVERLENTLLAELAATTIDSLAKEFAASRTSPAGAEDWR
jgi:Rrf2 family protein